MHEYLRDTLVYRYRECKSCANRTEFTCIKCGFCWSCHWKMEQIERIDLHNKPLPLVQAFRNYSQAVIEEKEPRKQVFQKLSPTVIDVYGEVAWLATTSGVITGFQYMDLEPVNVNVDILRTSR